ncbi:MAG: putative LPS assembly protein LptD [Bacteroidia bacterium]|nr:putative LPS assembly protein LptD [Bacteroidia bacterium]
MVQSFSLFSQEGKNVLDTLLIQQDSIIIDTAWTNIRRPSSNAVESKVSYSAVGFIKRDIINKKVVLIESAVVNYGEIEIKADSIVFNMKTNLLFAAGRMDTTGKIAGKPVFKEGAQEFEADELTYNFKTRKALIKNIITKQADGLLHSAFTKLLEDGTSNISRSTYSTCDADTPHFYINLPKARVYPGEKIISGPGNLVLEGIPLPLVIPFGFFPIQTKRAASGLLIPRIGEERERGYSLTDGGYYFAISDYFDLSLKGNLYSNGTWMTTAQTSYNRLYKYSGNFSFNYANNILGHKGLPDYSKSTNYRVGWTYTQDSKASPGSRFSASVNMSSSGFDRNNSYVVAEHITTQRQSSVSYSKSWDGTPFNLSVSMNHSQNVKNKTVSLNLPKVSFNAGRIYPLKSRNSSGPTKWYQELQLSYSASLDNQINTTDSLLFTREVWKNMRNGFKHDVPLSFQIRPFRNFSISPSVTYSGVMYTQKIEKSWDPDQFNVANDTTRGVFYGHAFNPSISASFNPQVFGTFLFINPNSRLQAIRHVIKPSIGFSFVPAFKGLSSDMYRKVQVDSTGNNFSDYSIYEGNIFGTPSLSSKSGNISLSLVNILEAKVFERNDTTGKAKKVKIIDNFGINTSYNIFADSMRWAPVSMQIRTTILNNFNISANSSFSLYGLDSNGNTINTFAYAQNKKLMRLNNFTTSLDFSLSELLKGSKDKNKTNTPPQNALTKGMEGNNGTANTSELAMQNSGGELRDEYGYPVFDVPWSLSLSYSLNYYKSGLTSNISQTLSFSGNVTITKKMTMNYTSGYDFAGKQITMTQIGMTRDLHCWEMNFNWVPNGSMKMWNFTIRVKASVLGDLKYERRKDFHDDY